MMGLDMPKTCRGWRNIIRISCASSWFFFTWLYRDARSTKHKIYTEALWSFMNSEVRLSLTVKLHALTNHPENSTYLYVPYNFVLWLPCISWVLNKSNNQITKRLTISYVIITSHLSSSYSFNINHDTFLIYRVN